MNKYFAIIENNIINGKGQCPCIGENITSIEIEKEVYDNLSHYMYDNGLIILNPDWEEEETQRERERLNNLSLSREEVFEALINARLMSEIDLKNILNELPETTTEQKRQKLLDINSLENAEVFHRGHDLVNVIGTQLNITSENLDKYFITGNYLYLTENPPIDE